MVFYLVVQNTDAMKVKELVQLLSELNQEAELVIEHDLKYERVNSKIDPQEPIKEIEIKHVKSNEFFTSEYALRTTTTLNSSRK